MPSGAALYPGFRTLSLPRGCVPPRPLPDSDASPSPAVPDQGPLWEQSPVHALCSTQSLLVQCTCLSVQLSGITGCPSVPGESVSLSWEPLAKGWGRSADCVFPSVSAVPGDELLSFLLSPSVSICQHLDLGSWRG